MRWRGYKKREVLQQVVLLQKFPDLRNALLWFFELKIVRCLGQKIILHGHNVTQVNGRQVGKRQGGVGSDDFGRAGEAIPSPPTVKTP